MENSVGEYKGTTTVAAVCSDGVILATDTRATMGNYVASKNAKKVYKITDRLAMTIAIGDFVAEAGSHTRVCDSPGYQVEASR